MMYEEMKVAELREECRSRGLQIYQHKHKLTKPELIESLRAYEEEQKKASEEEKQEEVIEEYPDEKSEEKKSREKRHTPGYIKFACTLEEIEKKYCHRKSENIYIHKLNIGAIVTFVEDLTTKNGEKVRLLRSAEVVEVNRESEKIKVQLKYGSIIELSYDDLIYISDRDGFLPHDIHRYMINQKKKRQERINALREKMGGL